MPDTPTTNTKADKDAYLLTVRDVFFCPKILKETTSTLPEYSEDVYRKTIAKKIEVKGNGKTVSIYASGVLIGTVAMENQEEISMDHIGIATKVLDAISQVAAENGISVGIGDATELPEFAWGFVAERSDGVMDAMWFPSCTLSPATELSYETSEDEFKEQDVSMSIIAGPLRYAMPDGHHALYFKYSNQRDTTLLVDDFMSQVVYDVSQIASLKSDAAPVAVTGVALAPTTANVEVGKTTKLAATLTPTNATNKTVAYTSSDEGVAKVSADGTVTGVKAGTAIITATVGGVTGTAEITVTGGTE
ncbi:Ig-like domain-containing protein [Loigolactobacillus bifermentans]|uniref:BIG2 domain-containing protein n=1 Tax=Loigolactobacillus bifermentans DSM 20003 TaxID=1423726 RepID=A0A0R1GXK8_9LACO|nr:Ig-like domain-containing protein [Loigolactobacillus bifermentans]KRK38982.1 hypothetical protein FC07_GL002698 [Loigolactobacillus bifermentans DSM 20003]QGG59133.1 hypothetical protein LB003_00910 [Loigolactobacillus bifermentans]